MFLASIDIDQASLIWLSSDISQSDGIPMVGGSGMIDTDCLFDE